MPPFDRVHTTSFQCTIVTMALSCVVSDILYSMSKKCCDLEIWVRGHSMSLKLVPFDKTGYGFLLSVL